jgi:hypothetical protein
MELRSPVYPKFVSRVLSLEVIAGENFSSALSARPVKGFYYVSENGKAGKLIQFT